MLQQHPDDVEALSYLATMGLKTGQYAEAERLFSRALRENPDDLSLRENFGIALQLNGNEIAARDQLTAVLDAKPDFYIARLFYARSIKATGDDRRALAQHARAIVDAQATGRWRSVETTSPWLQPFVRDAVRYINDSRRGLLHACLQSLRARFGNDELARVEEFISELVGPASKTPSSPLQRPKQHYIPGLPETPYIDRAHFPWMEAAEALTGRIRAELDHALLDASGFAPFLDLQSPQDVASFLRNESQQQACWDAFFFYRHGQRSEAHLAACPAVAELLALLPIVEIAGFAPEICFSLLTPGTHILPHTGDTNMRCVFHLPLKVPERCVLRVAGQEHAWREGAGVVFDDTFEHEAWNFGTGERAVLIADIWNPHLSAAEREALSLIVPLWAQMAVEATS